MHTITLVLGLLLAPGTAAPESAYPSPAASAQPAAEDPAVTKIAKAQFEAWKAGTPDQSLFIAGSAHYFTATVKTQIKDFLNSLGDVQSFTYTGKQLTAIGVPVDTYQIDGSKGSAVETIHIDSNGKIDFLYFSPPQK